MTTEEKLKEMLGDYYEMGVPGSPNAAILQNMLGADNELRDPQSENEALLKLIYEDVIGAVYDARDEAQAAAEAAGTAAEAVANKAPAITDTASGSIASFPDGANSVEVKSATVQIVPKQASGTPTPESPLPISGWDAVTVNVTGFNVWDEEWEVGAYNTSTGAKSLDDARIRCKNPIPVVPNTTYWFHFPYREGTYGFYVFQYDINGTFIEAGAKYNASQTFGANTRFVTFCTQPIYGTTYNHDISINYPATDTSYHAHDGTTYPLTLPSTVYGGTLTYEGDGVWTGESACAIKTLTGADTESWSVGSYSNFHLSVPDIAIVPQDELGVVACDALKAIPFANRGSTTVPCVMQAPDGTIVELRHMDAVGISTIAELKTWLASNNVTIVYKLATPQTYTVTTEQLLKTIKGQNNIFADCGPVDIEYRADTKLYIKRLTSPTDDDMTADANIASGTYFMVGNDLYISTTAIAEGDTIVPGTNCTRTNLAAALNALNA